MWVATEINSCRHQWAGPSRLLWTTVQCKQIADSYHINAEECIITAFA